jgi:hypothetical protein
MTVAARYEASAVLNSHNTEVADSNPAQMYVCVLLCCDSAYRQRSSGWPCIGTLYVL